MESTRARVCIGLASGGAWDHYRATGFGKSTLLLDENSPPRVYAVLGLTTELADIMPFPLPVMLQATRLPWKG